MIRWGIIGTGLIAGRFARGVAASPSGRVVAIGSRTRRSAETFGEEFNVAVRHSSYQALLDDTDVDAVYIATPHPMHAEWAIKAAEAGKHLLVEKPIGMNWCEAQAMIEAARVHDVFLMEAFMYRCHPQMAKLVELVRDGAIGQVQLIQAAFSYRSEAEADSRFFAQELGGGGILDVGCYPVSLARFVAGAATAKAFAEPLEVKAVGHLGETNVDEWTVATLKFPGAILAQLSCGVRLNQHEDNTVKIFGSHGTLLVPHPWVPQADAGGATRLWLKKHDENVPREILIPAPLDLYAYEADAVAANIANRESPAMTWDDTLGNMKVLDAWRREVGMVYESEKPANATHTITRRPLRVKTRNNMKYGRIAGLEKPVSRLVFGCDSNNTMPETAIPLDDFFERGGNTFDVSHGYGNPNGAPERHLGQWIANRGIRDQVVVMEKGANFPNDSPDGLAKEMVSGLERLQMEQVDIYMIHRDNESVPIGEWVDALNQHLRAGRMKVFGLSNFSVARLQAFHEYAAQHALQSFSAVSNQFSLARVLAPIWDMHLVSSSDAASRAWFEKTQTPLMPWSSQARGFFLPAATPQNRANDEWNRCWYSEENFRRQARAQQLAQKRGAEPINIALAYVLCQKFPTFPLIGPKQISETRSSLAAQDIALTPDEMAWLNLETDQMVP